MGYKKKLFLNTTNPEEFSAVLEKRGSRFAMSTWQNRPPEKWVEAEENPKVALFGRKCRAVETQKSYSRNASVGLLTRKSPTLAILN